jgi:hypothetical protein
VLETLRKFEPTIDSPFSPLFSKKTFEEKPISLFFSLPNCQILRIQALKAISDMDPLENFPHSQHANNSVHIQLPKGCLLEVSESNLSRFNRTRTTDSGLPYEQLQVLQLMKSPLQRNKTTESHTDRIMLWKKSNKFTISSASSPLPSDLSAMRSLHTYK